MTNRTEDRKARRQKSEGGSVIIATLQRMEKNLEEDRRQNRNVSTQLGKVISEMFEIRKENTFLRKKTEVLEKTCNDLRDDTERLERQLSGQTELRNTLEQYTSKDNIKIINFPNDSDTETADDTEKKVLGLYAEYARAEELHCSLC